jgi:sugar phosphate isomerase/epimerase
LKFAVSNIALNAYDHADDFGHLVDMGLSGLEVAPSRVWRDTWRGLTNVEVNDYRRRAERAGLRIVGLHSLFFDHPNLGLFKPPEIRARTLDFMEHLSAVCRDLGGRTLVYGGGRKRGDVALDDAIEKTVAFMGELGKRIEGHGTCFCFEPLGPDDTDFINSALESLAIATEVASPALRVQLDAKALVENNEADIETFRCVAPMLVHFHANEPGLGVLGSSGKIDHAGLGRMLRDIGYEGYVSIEQRMIEEADPLAGIRQSAHHLKECYA